MLCKLLDVPPPFQLFCNELQFFRGVWDRDALFTALLYTSIGLTYFRDKRAVVCLVTLKSKKKDTDLQMLGA